MDERNCYFMIVGMDLVNMFLEFSSHFLTSRLSGQLPWNGKYLPAGRTTPCYRIAVDSAYHNKLRHKKILFDVSVIQFGSLANVLIRDGNLPVFRASEPVRPQPVSPSSLRR